MKISDFSIKELFKILGHYLLWSCGGYWLLIYSYQKIQEGNGLEYFRLGNLPLPVFYETTYVEMVIYAIALVVSLAVGFYLRYVTYGDELHFKKMYNIKDDRRISDDLHDMGSDIDD